MNVLELQNKIEIILSNCNLDYVDAAKEITNLIQNREKDAFIAGRTVGCKCFNESVMLFNKRPANEKTDLGDCLFFVYKTFEDYSK